MPTLTKTDIAALRKGNDICVHLDSHNKEGLIRVIKRNRPDVRDPFARDVEHTLTATATLQYGWEEAFKAGQIKCFAMLGISKYHTAYAILRTLREGDELTFRFWPDAHSNGYVAAAHLHADALYLDVRREGKTKIEWALHDSICSDNSARMCCGAPVKDNYRRAAKDALANA